SRLMQLMPWSELILRLPAGRIPDLLPLAGEAFEIAGTALRLRPPTVQALRPAPALRSRLVTIKPREGFTDEAFAAAARRQLDALGVSPAAAAAVGRRRTLRIRGREIIGHELILEGLTAAESLAVQAAGLGGRRSMGCGLFVPLGVREGR
ncbi:MAG TPA: type I-MYXAN CRISPR-associated protein Cas6/Cmx6, partial [Planctomycetaceae bacterium]